MKSYFKKIKDNNSFFSYILCDEIIILPEYMPQISKVVSLIVETEIISKKIINTVKGISSEGRYLTGNKLIYNIKLKQKILYSSDAKQTELYAYQNECCRTIGIVIPSKINGSDIKNLLNYNYIKTNIKVNNTSIKRLNKNTFYQNIGLYIEAFIAPTYELSYSIESENKLSKIYICYANGSNKKQITSNYMNSIMPIWSPAGCEIAFLGSDINNDKYILYTYNLYSNKIKIISDSNEFDNISSFSWSHDCNEIAFSGIQKNIQDLYTVDMNTFEVKKITNNTNDINNYKPKFCPNSKKIAFLQAIADVADLYLKDMKSNEINRLTDCGFVKDYCWSNDGKYIIYIYSKNNKKDIIYILDIDNKKTQSINIPNNLIKLKDVIVSPNNKYIAFIGSNFATENIYTYKIKTKRIYNLTNNFSNINISSFDWHADSNKIYYSANDMQYYNMYVIDINEKSIKPISSTTSINIKTHSRPKII